MKEYPFDYKLEIYSGARCLLRSRIEADIAIIAECSKYKIDCIDIIAATADAITAYNDLSAVPHYFKVKDFMK